MDEIIIVLNKLPFEAKSSNGVPEIIEKNSGISGNLGIFNKHSNCKWVGWDGHEDKIWTKKETSNLKNQYKQVNCHPVFLNQNEIENHYYGFCNKTIWPLFHYFPFYCELNDAFWNAYKIVNQKFAETVVRMAKKGSRVVIHDFHLMLLPQLLRELRPDLSIGFFMHIPFPSFEVYRVLPWRRELIEGILGADLIGFHTFDYERHFMSSIRRLLGLDNMLNSVKIGERVVKIDNFPMGVDWQSIKIFTESRLTRENENGKIELTELKEAIKCDQNCKTLISIDRLDYAKGIPDRLEAFELVLKNNPDLIEKITMFLVVIPSREIVIEYQEQKRLIDEFVGRINGEFGTVNWMPIHYFYRQISRDETLKLFSNSDIALITPLRDGMNLSAKEYVATRTDDSGVLILSEMAGAAKEMSEAIIVNPYNKTDLANSIIEAFYMPVKEQKARNNTLRKRLKVYDDLKWATDFLNSLENVKKLQKTNLTKKVSQKIETDFKDKYNKTSRRIFFLDYDGTLTGFHNDPQKAMPDEELFSILQKLTSDNKNTIVIISGRDKETLGKWFSDFENITFIAEHGVWLKEPGSDWFMFEEIEKTWMEIIKPVINYYVDRTPRSLLEEKNYSLVWHYRHADPDLGEIRSWELKEELRELVANLNLEIMDGDKVIEVKNSGINKGRAASRELAKEEYDYLFAVGDDWTDEYTFGAMPGNAFTIKVGTKNTKARYYIENVKNVRALLDKLSK